MFNNENLEHKVAQRILAENGSRQQIEWNHAFSVTTACWRGVAMRQGSLQRGGLILKKGVVVDRRTFTRAKNDFSQPVSVAVIVSLLKIFRAFNFRMPTAHTKIF